MKRSHAGALALLLAALVAQGCQRDEPAVEPAVTEEPAVGGLSPEEIRMQAEPMSPEQAEQAGIVDTTIYVERLAAQEDTIMTPDTLPPPGTPRP
jgi:hypothetical protein